MTADSYVVEDQEREEEPTRVLAIASGGGHWVQLMRLRPAFSGHHVVYATVKPLYRADVGDAPFHVIPDATRWSRIGLIRMSFRVARIVLCERPHVIITTGAAPGLLAIVFGKLLGVRTCWIDSVANTNQLSLSGMKARRWATRWLTQWPQLAREDGPHFVGSVL